LSSKEYVAPRNETEAQLAAIWQELLGIDKVGIHDNFFELGGHSLLATRLVSMIRKEWSVEIEIADVFTYTTISELLVCISEQSKGILLPTIVLEDRPARIPLSFSQERLWFLDELQGSTEYHIPIVLHLEGAIDVSILEQTLKGIVSRHEVLRSLLLSEEGISYQEVISSENWNMKYLNIADETKLNSILEQYLLLPFDLSKDYKLRSCLYSLGNNHYVLASVFHHIASDGWSRGILINEFMELYNSFQLNRTPNLPELNLQYADYAVWQRKYLEGSVLESQLLYWEEKLQGVNTLSLPTDYARPLQHNNSGATISFKLDEDLSSSLRSMCQEESVTLFMLLLSVFKVLLYRYTGQEDICVGSPIANRTQSELEGIIGFFVNTLALRNDLSNDPSFRDLLARVKQTTLEGYNHQLAPFEKVVDRVVTTRDLNMKPLFQVMFVLQNAPETNKELELENIKISDYDFDRVTSQFDLIMDVSDLKGVICVNLEYSTALFDQSTINRIQEHYQELLKSILSDSTQSISNLSMLTKQEEHQLVDVFNDNDVVYPRDKTLIDLFEAQVKRTPDAIAVVCEGKSISYKELNERSNQLGRYLKKQNIVSSNLIAICLERSVEMFIGILGILKSGRAYLPIDIESPTGRIDYMLNDTGIDLVLSSSSSSIVIKERENVSLLSLDSDWDLISGYSNKKLSNISSPDNLAYVMYTSGTTGNPKGVMVTHGNIVSL
ncbi:condensation domain-containing protein, partial [Flavobacterium sp. W22_SRS_FK3]|uniref:condensation domain-containing protein n=1 Tax=Flavobacterium sp. W22_SRS_FK3 TaxID=3240275 RepID=UPI003F8EAC9E